MPFPLPNRRVPTDHPIIVRRAQVIDLQACRIIENDSAHLFAELGMPGIADDPSVELETLAAGQAEGRLWIAADPDDVPVGFALIMMVDGLPHLRELDVLTRWQRRGVGKRLITAIVQDARDTGHAWLTLTTFADVPWNAPYYARLGFEPIAPEAMASEMRGVFEHEAPGDLTVNPRVAMRLELATCSF